VTDPTLGDEISLWERDAPTAEEVAAYVGTSRMREHLFIDADYARSRGYRGVVVPGPLLTAFLEHYLRARLPGWRLERLSTSFRVPTITGDHLRFRGAITEHHATADGERLVCDVVIEHSSGDRAVTATATLRRAVGEGG
jgi:hydroxyacyl-ACP dehydratase HTD2-like protein with hotdog domain